MGSGRGKSARGRTGPPAQPIAYNVTGTLEPDATGNYRKGGTHNGKPYYIRLDGAWFIWWYIGTLVWVISAKLDNPDGPSWTRGETLEGKYNPAFPATGTATVASGRT